MKPKTKVSTEDGKQEIIITREFDLPVELLFKAYTEPEIIEQWMSNKVLKLKNKKHGSYLFETTQNGNVVFRANGTIHEFVPNQKITRTFEMENTPFPVQLEYLEFEKLTSDASKLTIHIVFKSVEFRNQLLQMPFAQGINMAHNRLQETLGTKSANIKHNETDILDNGPFYHGTKANLQIGDLLTAGFNSNYRPEVIMNHIYFTALVNGAGLAAELAKGNENSRVYIVEPTGSFENDPNVTDKKFPGNPTRSYRSQAPLKIIGEVTDWTRLTAEQLSEWHEKLANIKGEIIN